MKTFKVFAISLLALGVWLGIGPGGNAFAATITWDGTDCTATSDCDWSTDGNWAGGTAPVNGDDVIIHGDVTVKSNTVNDIASISLASLTTSGFTGGAMGDVSIASATPLTFTGDVTHQAPSASTPSGYAIQDNLLLTSNIVLGADSAFTDIRISGSVTNTITLGGNEFEYNLTSLHSGSTDNITPIITGTGIFTINIPTSVALFLNGDNDFSGTTNLNTADYANVSGSAVNSTVFGSSAINIGANARVIFDGLGTFNIPNVINVQPPSTTGSFLNDQIIFWAQGGAANFVVPNVTLLGDARFGVSDSQGTVSVNLAGITTNGNCIQYGDDNDDMSFFSNGPTACTVSVDGGTNTPSAPDTGFAALRTNPAVTLLAGLVSAGSLILIGRRIKYNK